MKEKDTILAGGGDDLFVSGALCEGDRLRGERGSDNANWAQLYGSEIKEEGYPAKLDDPVYEPIAHGPNVRLSGGTISRQGIGCSKEGEKNGTITSVENLEGSAGPDVLVGNGKDNVILGRSGSDVLRGRAGNDSILANNRNPNKGVDPHLAIDLDRRLECGNGRDVAKIDPADKKHFALAQLKGCETKPNMLVQAPANYDRSPGGAALPGPVEQGKALDERVIGGFSDPRAPQPVAFYRLDETAGTDAVDWSDPVGAEEEAEEESEGESEEELIEIEEEEAEEEEGAGPGGSAPEEEPHTGSYVNGVSLGEAGAMDESAAVHLDGSDDHLDLATAWDPIEFFEEAATSARSATRSRCGSSSTARRKAGKNSSPAMKATTESSSTGPPTGI